MKQYLYAAVVLSLAVAIIAPLFTVAGEASLTQPATPASLSSATTSEIAVNWKILRGQPNFWRLGQDFSGAWWFFSPDGQKEFMNTVTTVQPFQAARDANGPHYVSKDWDSKHDLNHWAQATLARVKDVGFKGLGAWCHPVFHNLDVPMTRDLNVWDWVAIASKRLYSPGWSSDAEVAIKSQCEPLRYNRNLVGYFTDNELDWGDGSSGPSIYFDELPTTDANRIEVGRVIQSTWGSLGDFNKDWGSSFKEWKDLDAWNQLPKAEHPKAYNRLFTAWLSHLSHDYFRITTALLHKYDPNHLILGVRFRGYACPEVVRSAAGYTDAQSLNYYTGDGLLDFNQFQMMYNDGKQPVIISEYSFNALDGSSGNRNTVGFAGQVPDQKARADGYNIMTTNLARVPYIIGADWFQWMDEPASGRSSDGEDVNFGIVDVNDNPYPLLTDAVRATTPLLNPIHQHSPHEASPHVWRESYTSLPIVHVPYLSIAPILDGNLNDWPTSSHLQGIRQLHTIGADRSPLAKPVVCLGWRNEGLYIGLEVFDNNIQSTSAEGWWWTKDNVELWISTKQIPADQTTYDVNCHQFFYVPQAISKTAIGVVGQWHREGDGLSDNLIPAPGVHQSTRVLPDRYIVEMLIPAKSLQGWNPAERPAMAFNIHVKNYERATDYFWSAPKEVMTQLRPDTWGNIALDPPTAALAVH